jgi:hypothetical protein
MLHSEPRVVVAGKAAIQTVVLGKLAVLRQNAILVCYPSLSAIMYFSQE